MKLGGEKMKARLPTIFNPKPSDYSPEAIQKKVLESSFAHPGTIYPLALGVGSAAAGFILGMPIFYLLALGGLVGPFWAVVQIFFLPERIRKKYLDMLDQQRVMYKETLKEQLKDGLKKSYSTDRANEAAAKGVNQFERIGATLAAIKDLLVMKLNTDELLFHRFLAAAEQTYLSVLDNLKDIIAFLKSADCINPEEIEGRLTRHKRKKEQSQAEQEENTALEERLQLWQDQMKSVDKMLAKNERAITDMEIISNRVAEWQTDQHFALADIEQTIEELQNLARFAHNLNGKNEKGDLSV